MPHGRSIARPTAFVAEVLHEWQSLCTRKPFFGSNRYAQEQEYRVLGLKILETSHGNKSAP